MTESGRQYEEDPSKKQGNEQRYTPPGHFERINDLFNAQVMLIGQIRRLSGQEFMDTADTYGGGYEPDKDEKLQDAHIAYYKYEKAIVDEQTKANTFLEKLAEPALPEPPPEQWSTVGLVDGNGITPTKIPFTQAELDAIQEASNERQRLFPDEDNPKRRPIGYSAELGLFPGIQDNTIFTPDLQNRPAAVKNIFCSARAAEEALTNPYSTNQVSPETQSILNTIRNLPDKMGRYGDKLNP